MPSPGPNQLDRALARRGDRQFGVASHEQLISEGIGSQSIFEAIAKLRLRPLWRSVYSIGHTALRREGWWYAALLACGDGSVLAGSSAGQFWRYETGPVFPIIAFVPGDRGRKLKGISARRVGVASNEAMTVNSIRVTTPARTLIDLCAHRTPRRRRELVERAQDIKRFDAAQYVPASRPTLASRAVGRYWTSSTCLSPAKTAPAHTWSACSSPLPAERACHGLSSTTESNAGGATSSGRTFGS